MFLILLVTSCNGFSLSFSKQDGKCVTTAFSSDPALRDFCAELLKLFGVDSIRRLDPCLMGIYFMILTTHFFSSHEIF